MSVCACGASRPGAACQPCRRASRKRWRDKNKQWDLKYQRAHRDKTRLYSLVHVLKRHGLTLLQYGQMMARQGGVCAICGRAEWHKIKGTLSRLKIDHDHATGRVRGLLCNECNRRLFHLEDPRWTEKALSYLKDDEQPKSLVR